MSIDPLDPTWPPVLRYCGTVSVYITVLFSTFIYKTIPLQYGRQGGQGSKQGKLVIDAKKSSVVQLN